MEGLVPNRSTGKKCSLSFSSGRPVVPLWEIREDLGRLPTRLKAHLRSTYIHLAIQPEFFCCCYFHAHMILVLLCNMQPSPQAPLPKGGRYLVILMSANLCPPMPGPMSTLVMERKSELESIKMYHLNYTCSDNLGIQTEKYSHPVKQGDYTAVERTVQPKTTSVLYTHLEKYVHRHADTSLN